MTLCIYKARCFIIYKLQTWVDKFNWPALINKFEHNYLKIFILQRIQDKVSIKTNTTVASMLKTKKKEQLESGIH